MRGLLCAVLVRNLARGAYDPSVVLVTITDQADRALIATAAFTGLRLGELLALRWSDVNFTDSVVHVRRAYSIVAGSMKSPKSGKERSVPMVEAVAVELAKLGQRDEFTADDDLVFAGWDGDVRDHTDVR